MKIKNILLLVLILIVTAAFATVKLLQTAVMEDNKWEGYDAEWKKIDSLDQQGLPQSALEIVEEIILHAEKDNNSPQLIKSITYKSKYLIQVEEDGNIKAMNLFEEKIKSASTPAKNIMQSMLAEMYWNYYSANRWRFSQRTETVNFKNDDIRTWDITTLHKKTQELYTASVTEKEILKKISIKDYDEILIKGDDYGRTLRPTLFDFIAHRALVFLMNDEAYITQPAYQFKLDDTKAFTDSKTFAAYYFDGKDAASKKLLALRLLQELTQIHINDANPAALIDVDINRLTFAKNNSVIHNKDSLYLQALLAEEKLYLNDSSSTRITLLIAHFYNDLGNQYDPFDVDQKYKWDNKKAIEYCDAAIKRFPNSYGAQNALYLKNTIAAKNIIITAEKVNVPDKPFQTLVTFKNVNTVYLRIAKLTAEEIANLKVIPYDEQIIALKKYPVLKEWEQKLPDDGDYNEHKTDIKIDGLPLGSYMLYASAEKDFSEQKNAIVAQEFWVSNIAFISKGNDNYYDLQQNSKDFYVVDRISGAPLKGALIQTYSREYDYTSRKYKYNEGKTYTTDANGYFSVSDPSVKDYYYFNFSIKYGKDILDADNSFYLSKPYKQNERSTKHTYFFTDRSIYRPGQTIYFKGIITEDSPDGKLKKVIANEKTTITFYDYNSQKIASADFISNDYGSFNGTFTAPQNSITGEMRIQNEYGQESFSIEEYKRPTFSVAFDPVKGSYILNDLITVNGLATSYAGANIDNAKVQYRVVRNASFPFWYDYGWWRKPYPNVPAMEITNGETVTNSEGKFTINFNAIPDLALDKKLKPQFSYTVYADITDISGETRSNQTYVSVGYVSLVINENVPLTISKDSLTFITISTTNLNGTPEPASGKIKIYPLGEPNKLFRGRILPRADKFVMTQTEYYNFFPYDVYADENNYLTWPVLNILAEINWDTKISDSIKLDPETWSEGKYKMVITTKDKTGEDIKVERYFDVVKGNIVKPPVLSYIYSPKTDFIAEPGDKINLDIASNAENVHAFFELKKPTKNYHIWKDLAEEMNRGKYKTSSATFEIDVEEIDRGGFNAMVWFVKDGRYYSQQYNIAVPWTNKDLKIELETHRDKLQPGEKETWKIKISGTKGEKVAAEMIASMYDASLNTFRGHGWQFVSWPNNYNYINYIGESFDLGHSFSWRYDYWNATADYKYFNYDQLNWFGMDIGYNDRTYNFGAAGGEKLQMGDMKPASIMEKESKTEVFDEMVLTNGSSTAGTPDIEQQAPIITSDLTQVSTRTNLNETAFFYPQLETDAEGNIIFSFTIPEALTSWNFMGLAHTKDLISNQIFSSVVTQKELMIQPNAPRFLREGDEIEFTAKISNLTDTALSGVAQLEILNAINMQPLDLQFNNLQKEITFATNGKGSAAVSWKLKVPDGYDAIVYKVKAKSGNFTDGEENALPVLTNRILVTESLPLWVRGNKTASFSFDKLLNSKNSTSIRNQSVTLEYTSNPAWYAVQALPYLMEYPYECAEQVFNRYYSNSIAYFIANSDPEIKRVFDSWKNNPESLTSNLEKNQELKSLMLEETPWVLQAQNETERKKRVALLFDVNRMNNEMQSALNKLEKLQLPNGGWPWFKGYEDDRYITQYIVTGLAHLKQLGITDASNNNKITNMLESAIRYCDARMLEDYKLLQKDSINKKNYYPSNLTIQYLYARSYFKEWKAENDIEEARKYYTEQIKQFWNKYSLFEKGMIALTLNRSAETITALSITKSLKEYSLNSDEMGMYWKDNVAGYYWNQAPIETQSLMIEVFGEVAKDNKSVEDLKVYLLRQKQTTDWKTTKATAEACYALLLRGNSLLANKELAIITVGRLVVQPEKTEAGTGYFKTNWLGYDINPDLGKITIQPSSTNELSYGAMYWQYFEDVDKITSSNTQLQLTKKLFIQQNSATGPVLKPIDEKSELHVGDLVKVRIELRVDRDMEYVHMKDMRASSFEPINVLSQFKYQDGLGYYEATGDASTNFFISYLNKGTYVFEYPVRVSHKGNFSNGITTIQCMYAPEFTSHSEGIRVTVK